MPSSQSSSSQSRRPLSELLGSPALIWFFRIVVGGLYAVSGFVKAVDPWGSVLKITEYFDVWQLDMPGAFVIFLGFLLGAFEFVWGSLLMLGCYRRCSVWMLTLQMAFFLPLTLYIAIYSPVDDCGCFGDVLIISNTATFVKNIAITLALVYLIIYNRRIEGLFVNYVQWIIGGLVTFYIFAVELYGYNVQPMEDFRRFPPGTMLVPDNAEDESGESGIEMEFVYEKDGDRHTFTMDNLPDSTWTFVERRITGGEADNTDGFSIIEDGEDIAPEIIDNGTEMFVVTIPDVRKVDLSCTYLLNELNDFITSRGGSMVALVGSGEEGIEWWRDISMATYPIIRTEPKQLLELARGNAALVYLDHGVVRWKRAVASITNTLVKETPSSALLATLDPEPTYYLKLISVSFGLILVVMLILDRSGKLLQWHLQRRKRKASAATVKPEEPTERK